MLGIIICAQKKGMTHIALQEQLDRTAVNWLEKITDEQYRLTK
jgi:hypothetical protein